MIYTLSNNFTVNSFSDYVVRAIKVIRTYLEFIFTLTLYKELLNSYEPFKTNKDNFNRKHMNSQ